MAEANETRAFYKVVSDFANLRRDLNRLQKDLAKTQAAEKAFNASSVKERAASTKASTTRAKALASENTSLKLVLANLTKYRDRQRSVTPAVVAANKVINAQNRALKTNAVNLTAAAKAARDYASAQRSISRATGVSSDAIRTQKEFSKAQRQVKFDTDGTTESLKKQNVEIDKAHRLRTRFKGFNNLTNIDSRSMVRFREETNKLGPVFARIESGGNRLFKSLEKFGNWRPRLVPPFVALIPIIGAVIAALNPLVSLLGAVGGAAIGLVGQIGSLSGAFLALPGILSAVAAGIGGVIASMGGVGNVFKTYSAMQKAVGKTSGGGGQSQAERAEALADAERNLAKAQRNVTKAQENLNKAREEALQDLIDLRMEVSRAGMSEERAIADLRLAQEAYWNVMADPGSTLGDKLDAAAKIKEAEADLEDVRKKNIKNQKDLTEAEKKGVNQSDKVLDAQESLADAYDAQRQAQRALKTEAAGGSSAIQALNDYNAALNELSPSARKFVLAILAMQDQWKAFRKDLQEEFFSRFVNDLDLLPQALRNLSAFLKPAVASMGDLASAFLNMFTSPEWTRDMATIGDQNGSVIRNLGEAGLYLATALKDIVIAAGPFTDWLTGAFAKGASNFSDFVADARETGSLAAWLDKVADRLERWWQIVKNIGKTIFNYSSAASEFGDWITDGLLEMTENWVKFSEDQAKPNSPFKQWLEDIKPVLQEVDRLLGSFFSWFAGEAADTENIQSAVDILRILTDDVGPALARLMDTLAKTDIDEKFLEALSSIIESIDTILENGGSAAFETFFDIVEGFFSGLAEATSNIPKPILEGLLSLFGLLAGITFIGKFTGLTNLLGGFLGFGAKATVFGMIAKMVKDFAKLDKMKFLGLLGKAGLFAGLAGLVVSLAVAGFNSFNKGTEARNLATDNGIGLTQDPKKAQATLDLAKTDGSQIASNTIFGMINELLFGIDDIFGTKMGEAFDSFLDDAIKNLANWVTIDLPNWANGVVAWWTGLWTSIATSWNTFWSPLVTWWDENFSQPILSAWKTFQDGLAFGVAWLQAYVIIPFQLAWLRLTIWFDQTFVQPIKRAWSDLQTSFLNGWNWINQYVLSPFKLGLTILQTSLGNIVTGMGNKWAELRKKFAEPVAFVIDTVYNNGIRSFWNGINSALKLNLALPYINPIKFADGGVNDTGVLPGYTPGRDVHQFYSPTGGRLDLSGGEAIMRPEFTKLVGGKQGIDELNKKAKRGEAFANGGVWGGSGGGSTQKFADGGIWEVAGDIWDKFSGFFSSPAKFVKDGIGNIINPLMKNLGGGDFGKLVGAMPGAIVNNLAGAAEGKAKTAKRKQDTISADPNGMKWQAMWAAVHKQFPSATLNSSFRPGAITSTGSKSYHSMGRAIDVTPSAAIFNWIKSNFPSSRELIYSPMGGQQLQNGQPRFWGEPVRSQHWDHVHWAMKNGGVIPGLYDNGGWLPHGGMAVNKSGKPEAVLDPTESRALKALLGGSGLMGRNAIGSSPAALTSQMAPVVNDYSVKIEQLTMVNPVPEPVSESLPKSIRKIAYMNQARGGSSS